MVNMNIYLFSNLKLGIVGFRVIVAGSTVELELVYLPCSSSNLF